MAGVYEAVHPRGQAVAIKVLSPARAADPMMLARFQREARVAASLSHPNLVKVYSAGAADGCQFIAMELIDGVDFLSYVRDGSERLRPALAQLAGALFSLHHDCRILHRDIKPSNVLVTAAGVVKLLDFGLAREISNAEARTQRLAGTPAYMAPEVCSGNRAGPSADLYSLICSYYFLLTSQLPFESTNPAALIYQHDARGAHQAITGAIDMHVQVERTRTSGATMTTTGARAAIWRWRQRIFPRVSFAFAR